MVTTPVHIEPPLVERNHTGNGRMGLTPAKKSQAGTLARIWALVRGNGILAEVGRPVLEFHDWISGPPMTERDRIKQYIVETRKASNRRRLAGR